MVKTYREALAEGNKFLREHGIEGSSDARVLMCHASGMDTLRLTVYANDDIPKEILTKFEEYINRRCNHEPVSYITGTREFMGMDFLVKPGILIPRPETEHTVEYIINSFESKKCKIADLCTGSGAIGVSLAKYMPDCEITAVDISDIAVSTARDNASKHNVANRVQIIKADVLNDDIQGLYDAVVSNPPYIPDSVVETLDEDVQNYEPHLALKGGDDGLVFYRKITEKAKAMLKDGGLLVYEVGYDQAEQVAQIMSRDFEDISFEKDLAGIDRVVHGKLKTIEKK